MNSIFFKIFFTILFLHSVIFPQTQITQYVNPFIGTSSGGNTFPGAVLPWGMASVSPYNAPGSPSGYIYGEKYFYGFGHNHLSGTGCSDLGSIIVSAIDKTSAFNPESCKSVYSDEYAEPGYYSLYLDNIKIKAEVTATLRCGFLKFISDTSASIKILFDVGRSLNLTGGGCIKIISDNEIEGSNISGGFCGEENRQVLYFAAKLNYAFSDYQILVENRLIKEKNYAVKDSSIGCFLEYNISPNNPLLIKVGISYVSIDNARENLEKEIPAWDFDIIRKSAKNTWEEILSRIRIEDHNKDNKIKFYTAIYHMLLHPNLISDINGEYPLMGRIGTGKYTHRNRYTVFSLWDTYRTLHPFLTLVYPERQSEMIKTMLDMYKENGYLPKWELTGNETYMMVGDPAAPVIADSYIKGIRDFDPHKALEAVLKPAILKEHEHAPPIRAGYHQLLEYGYIPFEQNLNEEWWVWGPVSTTLEYCFSDWTISQMAKSLGREDLHEKFLERSYFYKNLFDTSSLFMRPKLKNGNWLTPFDTLTTEGSGYWQGSGGPGYVEGNAWHYTWFVPHDVEGLIDLFGDEEIFSEKLMRAFSNNHFTINNEPDISYPYLFTYINNKEYLTTKLVKSIMTNDFSTGTDGLPGNDDCGTISGWFVFSALGFYPVTPAKDAYTLGIPLFDKITINLNNEYYKGDEIKIINKSSSLSPEIYFNNIKIGDYQIRHNELINGGELVFQ